MALFIFLPLPLCVACDDVENQDAGVPIDASPMAECPSDVLVSTIESIASPNDDPAELLWSVKGYGMKVGPGQHNGVLIAEQLVAIEDEGVLSDDFSPVGVEVCPFVGGDAGRVFSCGSVESVFRVGGSGEVRYDGSLIVQFDAAPNVFWDPYAIVADGSPLATVNEILADNEMPLIERCRLGCIQTYHCEDQGQPPIGLFYRIEDYVYDQPVDSATDVETRVIDENGDSH